MSEQTLGQQIAAARNRHHLSQSELAEQMDVAKYSIHRWEHDKAIPRSYAQRWLIEHLGISPEAFMRAKQEDFSQHWLTAEQEGEKEDIRQYLLLEEKGFSEEDIQEAVESFKIYHGWREGTDEREDAFWKPFVEVDGRPLSSFDPTWYQYEWGYMGTGPYNLAVSILADYFGEHKEEKDRWKTYRASHYASDFRDEVIARFSRRSTDEWWITSIDISQWIEKHDEKIKNKHF